MVRREEKTIQELVSELSKTNPDQKKVKRLMTGFGLEYTPDPIIQMSMVLQDLNQRNILTRPRAKAGKEL